MNVLHFSEQAAYKRIRVARMARKSPAIYGALAEGRVHLSGLVLLKPFMTRRNVDELLTAITHRSSREIKTLLAEQYPQADVPTKVRALPRARVVAPQSAADPNAVGDTQDQLSPRTVGGMAAGTAAGGTSVADADPSVLWTEEHLRTEERVKPAKVEPLAPRRYSLQLTMSQEMHDKLRHAQALLSHSLPSGDVTEVLERALDALIVKLEKSKFAATDRPHETIVTSANPRHVSASVKRAVRERDGCQCTFVSEAGQRCPERRFLEFDHVDAVARGGEATADRMRLRCRSHNQYGAEQTFGTGFMQHKRDEARRAAIERRAAAATACGATHALSQFVRSSAAAGPIAP